VAGAGAAVHLVRRHPTVALGLAVLAVVLGLAVLAPWLRTVDPILFTPAVRLNPPSERFWFGTDGFGRDVYIRTLYAGRISLIVGLPVAAMSRALGLTIGLVAGYLRAAAAVLMRCRGFRSAWGTMRRTDSVAAGPGASATTARAASIRRGILVSLLGVGPHGRVGGQ